MFAKKYLLVVLYCFCLSFSREVKFNNNLKYSAEFQRNQFYDDFSVHDENFGQNWSSYKIDAQSAKRWADAPALFDYSFLFESNAVDDSLSVFVALGFKKDLEAFLRDQYTHNVILGLSELNINAPDSAYLTYKNSLIFFNFGRKVPRGVDSLFQSVTLNSVHALDGIELYSNWGNHLEYSFGLWALDPWLSRGVMREDSLQNLSLAVNQRGRIYNDPHKSLLRHRLDWRGEFIDFGMSEYIVIGGKSVDLSDMSPFVFWHNNFGDGYSNSFFSFDLNLKSDYGRIFAEVSLDEVLSPVGEQNGDGQAQMAQTVGYTHKWKLSEGRFSVLAQLIHVSDQYGDHPMPLLTLNNRKVLRSNVRDRNKPNFADTWIVDFPLGYWRENGVTDLLFNLNYERNNLGYHCLNSYYGGNFDTQFSHKFFVSYFKNWNYWYGQILSGTEMIYDIHGEQLGFYPQVRGVFGVKF